MHVCQIWSRSQLAATPALPRPKTILAMLQGQWRTPHGSPNPIIHASNGESGAVAMKLLKDGAVVFRERPHFYFSQAIVYSQDTEKAITNPLQGQQRSLGCRGMRQVVASAEYSFTSVQQQTSFNLRPPSERSKAIQGTPPQQASPA